MDNSCENTGNPHDPSSFTVFSDTPCQLSVNNSKFVLKVLRNLYEEKRFCDVYLKVGNKEYGAHKLILSASSDVFQVMLMRSDWTECHQKEIKLGEVPQCEKVFHLFLEYFYTGEVMITHTNVQPILSLADKYMVKSLSKLCLQYMYDHVSHAASHNQLFVWLQYCQSCGHKEMASFCEEYIKLNFEAVSNSADFCNLDAENMVLILKEDELVVYNEALLYNCIVRWLNLQKSKLEEENTRKRDNGNPEPKEEKEIAEYVQYLTELVMQYIRFPMMKPREIADLLRSPLVKEYKEFFLERMSISVELHSSNTQDINDSWLDENRHLIQPRLYTVETNSAILYIEDFTALPRFHKITYDFETDYTIFECPDSSEKNSWQAYFFPKGVLYDPCYLLVWPGHYEIPEKEVRTVRMTLLCTKLCKPGKFKFSILVYGVRGKVEHIMKVKSEIHCISEVNTSINIDNIIPFDILNPPTCETSDGSENSHLSGMHNKELKLQIIITPLS